MTLKRAVLRCCSSWGCIEMKHETQTIAGIRCEVYGTKSDTLLLQPVDDHDLEMLDQETEAIEKEQGSAFCLCAFRVPDWNRDLTPWGAPPVFGEIPFGDGAGKTLEFVMKELLPEVGANASLRMIGGYSLAGLFALWAAYNSDAFCGVAGVSPSVWYPGWGDYIRNSHIRVGQVYLSLGDREEFTKNPQMALVGDLIRLQYARMQADPVVEHVVLEWNKGNHFAEPGIRTAKGFAWLLKQQAGQMHANLPV